MPPKRRPRVYDHRLVRLVQQTGDATIATRLGVPRSTAYGWLRRAPRDVTTAPGEDRSVGDLLRELAVLRRQVARWRAALRVLFVLFRIVRPNLARLRIPAPKKERLLRAVDRTRGVLGLRRVLSLFGLSASRLHAWRVAAAACELADHPSCPRTSPQRLTPSEIARLRSLVTSDDYRHVPTTRLALLAQRLAHVFVSASTLCRLVRVRGWRRPRLRVYPALPREGVRASRPNELWHVDVTILKLLDGTRAYLHAVIDNFSRRILAWRVADRLLPGGTVAILLEAALSLAGGTVPTLLADAGSENVNDEVDALVEAGLLRRVLAQTEVVSSNSLIEAFWRSLKHHWLFLNSLDTLGRLRSLVAFYVAEHNATVPHAAFRGQTPDEVYFGTGDHVPEMLAARRRNAREVRLAENRAARCGVCSA